MTQSAIIMRCRWLAVLLAGLVVSAAAQEAQPPARVSVLVFEQGRPVPGLTVELGGERGLTDVDGAWSVRLPAGRGRLEVREHGVPLAALPVEIHSGEVAQYIITLTGPERRALVSIESSHGSQRGAAAGDSGPVADAAGRGLLSGRVVSSEDGQPIRGARVFVSGTPAEARTDADGRYSVELPSGRYSVSVLHGDFATRTVEDVQVRAGESAGRDFELPPAGLEMAEYVVVEPHIEGSMTAVVATRRDAASVTDVLSAEQISRAGDSDAAGALKRVTGLTLVDGEYIYVRGLGERYSSVLLNNAAIPSPDPTRRVVPLDLFPTDVIRDVVVQKTATAAMPGEFGGGSVQLSTLGFPEGLTGKIGVSGGYRSGATGTDGPGHAGGGRDWSGRDDGTRAMPASLAEATAGGQFLRPRSLSNPDGLTQAEFAALGEDLAGASGYATRARAIRPDFGISGHLGNAFDLGGWLDVGVLGAFRYSNSWDYREEETFNFRASDAGLELRDFFDVERTRNNIDFSAFINLSARAGDNSEIGFTRMLLRQTTDETVISEGEEDTQKLRRMRLQWEENELDSRQLFGRHNPFGIEDLTFSWQYTDAVASRHEPNTRQYRRDDDDEDGDYVFSRRADSNSQSFGELEDGLIARGFDLSLPVPVKWIDSSVSGGYSDLRREREASIRTFSFSGQVGSDLAGLGQDEILSPDNIAAGLLRLRETTQPTDNYTAAQRVSARYLAVDARPFEWLRVNAGLRWENNFQEVVTSNLSNPQAPPVVAGIDDEDELASAALTWHYAEPAQVRLGYSETLSRPDFRELSPAPFLDPVLDLITVGNPDLRVAAIRNYDLRWEYYFDATDSISVAAFYKDFARPIEKTFSSGGSARIITLRNAVAAEVEGWEVDLYKSLGFIERAGWLDRIRMGWLRALDWHNFYLSANYADIESSVELEPGSTTQTNVNRPLQGQSPYVVNFQVGYTSDEGDREWTLLFNQFGERIVQAGVQRQPDVFEQPFAQLDFVYKQRFAGHWQLSAKLTNLLDPQVEFTQGDEVTRRYRKGRGISLGLELAF